MKDIKRLDSQIDWQKVKWVKKYKNAIFLNSFDI